MPNFYAKMPTLKLFALPEWCFQVIKGGARPLNAQSYFKFFNVPWGIKCAGWVPNGTDCAECKHMGKFEKNAGIVVDVLASFIIPGFGLFLQKRWRESAAFFFSTVLAFFIMPIAAYVLWLCGIYYTLRMDLSQSPVNGKYNWDFAPPALLFREVKNFFFVAGRP